MKNITVALICLIALATFSGCRGNSSSTTVEKPSYKYTVYVTRGLSGQGMTRDVHQTDIIMLTNSGVQFKTAEGKSIYTSNYVVYEN